MDATVLTKEAIENMVEYAERQNIPAATCPDCGRECYGMQTLGTNGHKFHVVDVDGNEVITCIGARFRWR
jgi:hypothetical protein